MRYIAILLILFVSLQATFSLKDEYYFKNDNINSKNILPTVDKKFIIKKNLANKDKVKIETKKLIELYKQHGVKVKSSHRYTYFYRKSNIDINILKNIVKNYYKNNFEDIVIEEIIVKPRAYLKKLPNNYSAVFNKRAYLRDEGVFYISDVDRKRYYFDYKITAYLNVYESATTIQRYENITFFNTIKDYIKLEKLHYKPIDINKYKLQSKLKIKPRTMITEHNTQSRYLVKKGETILAIISVNNLSVETAVVATKNARLGDIINVKKMDGSRLRAKVIGLNKVEIQ